MAQLWRHAPLQHASSEMFRSQSFHMGMQFMLCSLPVLPIQLPLPVLGKFRELFGCFVSVSAAFLGEAVLSAGPGAQDCLALKLHLCHFLVKKTGGLFSYFSFLIFGTVRQQQNLLHRRIVRIKWIPHLRLTEEGLVIKKKCSIIVNICYNDQQEAHASMFLANEPS